MDSLLSLLGRNGFLPHGYCFTWSPGLLWSMVGADAVIAASYFSIPVAIMSYTRRRPAASTNWLAWLFSAFIFSCGITHLMGIWTIWQPDYGLQALTKIATAVISLVTAVALWPLIPKALKIPSVQQLQSAINKLEAEVGRRRSAEDQLAAIQQSLAVTLASIDAGFIAADRNGKVTHLNSVAETVTGVALGDALGHDFWTVFEREGRPPQDRLKNPLDVIVERGLSVETALRVVAISRTGTRTPLEVKVALTRNDIDGQVTGMAMVFRDMSRIDQAEAESKRLSAIVESSNDAIISKTLDGRITSWNGAAQALFGYTAEEAIGQPVQMLIPLHRQGEEMRILAELANGKSVPAFDTVRLRRDGEPLDVSITISPIRDTEGRIVGASKIARDVSEQRRAEAALRTRESELEHALQRVTQATKAGGVGLWEWDLTTDEVFFSDEWKRQLGHAPDEIADEFEEWRSRVHPDDLEPTLAAVRATLEDPRRPYDVTVRMKCKDGTYRWFLGQASVLLDEAGRSQRMLGSQIDVTERRQAENARLTAQRLEAENRQIQEASRMKSQFLANMSHELRTPLNAVIGFADLLHSGFVKPDSPKHQEFLGHIGTSGRHLLQLINDVLDLSKVESGKFEFYPEHIDLPVLLKEVQDVLHTAVTRKNIRISTDFDADLSDLTLDPARLKQVLYNYLSNAIKFTATGGQVTVRAMAEGPEHFRIEVEDSGIGISAVDLPRLFTEFQQLDAGYSKQHQGTGLGLALTRRLVQAQGGKVGVRSTLGVGSVFYVVLNRTDGMDTQRAEAIALGVLEREAERVLVIEDDVRDQQLLVEAFSQAGFAVDTAADSSYAVQRARDTAYAALTLDMNLPGRRGLELLGDIRSRGASHASPVVGVTMPADQENSAAFTIANVLCKPIRSDEILSAMARFRIPGERRANVMVIDDEQVSLDLMQATLRSIDIDAICFQDGRVALQEIDRHRPDAIVLDLMMPGLDGFQVLDALQRLPAWREVPVFIWTSMLLTDEEYATLARSARAILIKGGGAMEIVLDSVRRWRKPVVADTGPKP